MIIFNGSVWHGHTANRSALPRRSIQGAFIPRDARAAINQTDRIRPETLERIGNLARYVLNLEQESSDSCRCPACNYTILREACAGAKPAILQ